MSDLQWRVKSLLHATKKFRTQVIHAVLKLQSLGFLNNFSLCSIHIKALNSEVNQLIIKITHTIIPFVFSGRVREFKSCLKLSKSTQGCSSELELIKY